jgi:hypothetical protein
MNKPVAVGKKKTWRDETKDLSLSQAKFPLNQKQLKQSEKNLLCAKILSKHKTPLPDIWKIFYRDQQNQQKGFFLLNDYHRPGILPDLEVGSEKNILLVSGYKHQFFSRIWK